MLERPSDHPDYPFVWFQATLTPAAGAIYGGCNFVSSENQPVFFTQVSTPRPKIILVTDPTTVGSIRVATLRLGISLIQGEVTRPPLPVQRALNVIIDDFGLKL